MFWFALAGIALSAAQAGKGANAANQNAAASYSASLRGVNAENEAIAEANAANVIRTGYRVGIHNLQQSRAKKQAIEQGYDISVQGAAQLGDSIANAAASGTVGSSVDAAVDLIKKKEDEALIDLDQAYAENVLNSNLELEQIIMQGKDALLTARDINSTMPKYQNATTAALLAGAGTFANMYASDKLSLGTKTSYDVVNIDTYRASMMDPIQAAGSPKLNFSANTRLS